MKTCAVFVVLALILGSNVDATATMEDVMKILDFCKAESGVTLEQLENCNHGEFAEEDALKCYMKCFYVQANLFKDGVIDPELVIAYIPDRYKEKYTSTIRTCSSETTVGANDCETAFLLSKCHYRVNPKDFEMY